VVWRRVISCAKVNKRRLLKTVLSIFLIVISCVTAHISMHLCRHVCATLVLRTLFHVLDLLHRKSKSKTSKPYSVTYRTEAPVEKNNYIAEGRKIHFLFHLLGE
jgi:hypothetical protein